MFVNTATSKINVVYKKKMENMLFWSHHLNKYYNQTLSLNNSGEKFFVVT